METKEIKTEQRTAEWFTARKGRFTGSEIHLLMGIKGLGKTGEAYCFKKAIEVVYGLNEDERFTTFDMQRGIDLEPVAFAKFKELKGLDFKEVEECSFFAFGDNSGASPDGLVDKDAVLEIKCPKSEKFFNLVANGEGAIDKAYLHQMQCEMMCTNSQKAYFFNFLIHNGVEMHHTIEVERDEELIEKMKARIEEAVVIRDQYVKQLTENKQF